MPFVSVPGLKGKVYVPAESRAGDNKHPCQDCFACQHCSDDRCGVCLNMTPCSRDRLLQASKGAIPQKINARLVTKAFNLLRFKRLPALTGCGK